MVFSGKLPFFGKFPLALTAAALCLPLQLPRFACPYSCRALLAHTAAALCLPIQLPRSACPGCRALLAPAAALCLTLQLPRFAWYSGLAAHTRLGALPPDPTMLTHRLFSSSWWSLHVSKVCAILMSFVSLSYVKLMMREEPFDA